jgi:hypothetical protein
MPKTIASPRPTPRRFLPIRETPGVRLSRFADAVLASHDFAPSITPFTVRVLPLWFIVISDSIPE